LQRLVSLSKQLLGNGKPTTNSSFQVLFGYFAQIELARLECLLGDFGSSLQTISAIKISDRTELLLHLPICHFNVFYHCGVSNMMMCKFHDAIDIFSEIILHVVRILKPGAGAGYRGTVISQLQRMLDKVLSLTAICITIFPSGRVDDQIKELVESKFPEKIRGLQSGIRSVYLDMFEQASPKFVSPVIPDYRVPFNYNHEAFNHQVSMFIGEVEQHFPFLKLKSYLGLYSSIDVSKLARFNDLSDNELICQLVSYKNKSIQNRQVVRKGSVVTIRSNLAEAHYYIDEGILVIANTVTKSDGEKANERFFISGIRKHSEIIGHLSKTWSKLDI
jgi:translation initiation factor 3 subunit L